MGHVNETETTVQGRTKRPGKPTRVSIEQARQMCDEGWAGLTPGKEGEVQGEASTPLPDLCETACHGTRALLNLAGLALYTPTADVFVQVEKKQKGKGDTVPNKDTCISRAQF